MDGIAERRRITPLDTAGMHDSMGMQKILADLYRRLFTDEMAEAILEAQKQGLWEDGYGFLEQRYQNGRLALFRSCSEAQKAELDEMERLHQENIRYAMSFAFQRGIFAAFQQYFTSDNTGSLFSELIEGSILDAEGRRNFVPYIRREEAAGKLAGQLAEQTGREQEMAAITSGWSQWEYGTLTYSFYLGYHAAVMLIDGVDPETGRRMAQQIAATDEELGFSPSEAAEMQAGSKGLDV